MAQRRCTYKHKNLMVARRYARTYHCTARATVRKADHYHQGHLLNWLCADHADSRVSATVPVTGIFVMGVISAEVAR